MEKDNLYDTEHVAKARRLANDEDYEPFVSAVAKWFIIDQQIWD